MGSAFGSRWRLMTNCSTRRAISRFSAGSSAVSSCLVSNRLSKGHFRKNYRCECAVSHSRLSGIGATVLLLESLPFGERPAAGLAARTHLAVATHQCVLSQYCRQGGDEHLALLV